jgi:hypothetical protein
MIRRQNLVEPGTVEDEAVPRSIYDDPDEPELERAPDPEDDGPPWCALGEVADAAGGAAADWAAALGACGTRALAAAAGVARLDERFRLMDPAARRAALERLAVVQAARLMWADGDPVDPFAMALDAARRRGRAGDDAPAMTKAHRLARRLVAPGAAGEGWPADLADPAPGGHGLSRAAALEQALRRDDPGATADAAVAAMRLAARAVGGGGQGDGARFAPLPARRRRAGPAPVATLDAFLADLADGAADARATLEDLAAWRARADAAAAAMKGSTPARLVDLLARRLAVGAPEAAQALGLSESAAARALDRLTEAGVARELTGQGRFRAWGAKV